MYTQISSSYYSRAGTKEHTCLPRPFSCHANELFKRTCAQAAATSNACQCPAHSFINIFPLQDAHTPLLVCKQKWLCDLLWSLKCEEDWCVSLPGGSWGRTVKISFPSLAAKTKNTLVEILFALVSEKVKMVQRKLPVKSSIGKHAKKRDKSLLSKSLWNSELSGEWNPMPRDSPGRGWSRLRYISTQH